MKDQTYCDHRLEEHFKNIGIKYQISDMVYTQVHLLCISRLSILVECTDKSGWFLYRPIPLSVGYDNGITTLLVVLNKCYLSIFSHLVIKLLMVFANFEFDVDRTRSEALRMIEDLSKISGVLGEMDGNVCLNDIFNTFITQQGSLTDRIKLFRRYNIQMSNVLKLVLLHLPSDDLPDAQTRAIPGELKEILLKQLAQQSTQQECEVIRKFLDRDPVNTYTREQLVCLVSLNAKRFNVKTNDSWLSFLVGIFFLFVILCSVAYLVSFLIPYLEDISFDSEPEQGK